MIRLTPTGGSIAAQVYRRPEPILSWAVSIDLARDLESEHVYVQLVTDHIPWAFGDWRRLDGAAFECDDTTGTQSAFFWEPELGDFDPALAKRTSISLRLSEENRFIVELELDVEDEELGSGLLSLTTELPFVGVLIQPLNVVPFPRHVEEVRELVEALVEPSAFLPPELDGTSYVCPPRI